MNVPQTAWTVNHTIVIDRAGHLVIEKIDEKGRPVKAVDLGINHESTPMILTWLEMEHRDELAPAIDAWAAMVIAKFYS